MITRTAALAQRLDDSPAEVDLELARPEEATIEPQNAEAFERLLSLRSGDYAELLMRGEVIVHSADPGSWRKQIRSQARLDRLRIRTGKSSRDPSLVWAIRLRDSDGEPDDDHAFLSTIAYQDDVQALARARAHTLERWTVYHEGQAAGRCTTCGARAFVDTTGEMPIVDGEVLDRDCPGFWSPPDEARPRRAAAHSSARHLDRHLYPTGGIAADHVLASEPNVATVVRHARAWEEVPGRPTAGTTTRE